MDANAKPLVSLVEIKEDLARWDAEHLMREGWVYLGLRVKREVYQAGDFADEITYIVGKPAP